MIAFESNAFFNKLRLSVSCVFEINKHRLFFLRPGVKTLLIIFFFPNFKFCEKKIDTSYFLSHTSFIYHFLSLSFFYTEAKNLCVCVYIYFFGGGGDVSAQKETLFHIYTHTGKKLYLYTVKKGFVSVSTTRKRPSAG